MVVIDSSELMIIDILTKDLLLAKQYKHADPVYVEISGDGNDVNLIRDKEIYKFSKKD